MPDAQAKGVDAPLVGVEERFERCLVSLLRPRDQLSLGNGLLGRSLVGAQMDSVAAAP